MQGLPVTQVRDLPYYGRNFPFIPWTLTSKLLVSFVFAGNLYGEFGPIQFVAFWLLMPFHVL
jgi:hypothetical protein